MNNQSQQLQKQKQYVDSYINYDENEENNVVLNSSQVFNSYKDQQSHSSQQKKVMNIDDMPITSAKTKTFEELLESQLKGEGHIEDDDQPPV